MLRRKSDLGIIIVVAAALLLTLPALSGATSIPPDTPTIIDVPDSNSGAPVAQVEITWVGDQNRFYFSLNALNWINRIRITGRDSSGDYLVTSRTGWSNGAGVDVFIPVVSPADEATSESRWFYPYNYSTNSNVWLKNLDQLDTFWVEYAAGISVAQHKFTADMGLAEFTSYVDYAAVPEPGTLLLLGLGMLTLGFFTRKRTKQ